MINDVINGEAVSIDVEAIDVIKCFEEMGYEETHNDLWDVCPKDDKFHLIAKLDEEVNVKINTAAGPSEEFTLNKLVLQGTVFGPLLFIIMINHINGDQSLIIC